jgi:hypothetical protein
LKLMLLADADPTLQSWGDRATYEDELQYGTVVSELSTVLIVGGSKHVQTAMEALLDLGQPYVTANGYVESIFGSPLLYLAGRYSFMSGWSLDIHEKMFLLLECGADIAARGRFGGSCLHVVLEFDADVTRIQFPNYQEEEFKDILMCMVTAGADVAASNGNRRTVSQTAVKYGHEELWREVLAECGYDPDAVFCLEHEFDCLKDNFSIVSWVYNCRKFHGMRAFSTATPVVRSTKLSFAEYRRQRKSLDCVQKVYSREGRDIEKVWRDRDEFWESIVESPDSEDYDWVSVEEDDHGEGDDVDDGDGYGSELAECSGGEEEYSDGDEAYSGDTMTEGYPEWLHNGVCWQIVFS